MKKITLLLSSLLMISSANAQIFSDNFDALNAGDYIGPTSPYWSTWSGALGGAEDAQATTAQASSAPNSVYFSSTGANGGPQDVLLDFGQQYTDGVFTFESKFFIDAGKNAYFNFQGTTTPGGTYTINCNMDGGMISIDNASAVVANGTYTDATWFTLRIEANLSTGRWQLYVDGNCSAVWNMPSATVASVDLYPINNSSFYIDDIMFDHVAYTPSALNATVAGFDMGGSIAGLNVNPTVTVANSGTTAITSFDVTIDYNGAQYTENVTGANITAGGSMDVVFTNTVPLVAGAMTATATISNINGGTDGDVSDNDACSQLDPVVPAPGKVVVGEEGTGTWCGWCPRGAVFMDKFEQEYGPYWAGIAVHNGDPMVVATYDAGIGALIGGYPSALVDRGPEVDPSSMSNQFFTRLQTAPTAVINNTYTWDATTRELVVTVTADFQSAATDQYKLACVLTEDGVTGTTSGYAQTNYYSGGSNGVMGGYELLANPVPAADMVYDHVARAIQPAFGGDANSFPATVNAGEQHSKTYTFVLPAEWNENNIHIIGMLIAPNGTIDNAGKLKFGSVGINEINDLVSFRMYPNPTSTYTILDFELENESDVVVTVYDMTGKIVASRDYGQLSSSTININTIEFETGVYLVELMVNNQKTVKRLIVE